MKKWRFSLVTWVKANRTETIILGIILFVAAFCRLYKIDQYMTFLGDEGRDVIIVRDIFVKLHPPLIGPGTSIGNMYLGPLYYYMMALPLLLAGFSPVGPAVMVAVLGIITVGMVWWIGREWFPSEAGKVSWGALIASGLYAISPTVIIYTRSSWNPNIMPFFALLSIYSIWRVWRKKELNWLIVMGISFAFVLQSHYLGLLLTPTLFIFWCLSLLKIRKEETMRKVFVKKSIVGIILFFVLMSPLFFFDVRHNFINTKAVYAFFTDRQVTVSAKPWSAIPKIPVLTTQIVTSLIGGRNVMVGEISSIVVVLTLLYFLFRMFVIRKTKLKGISQSYYLIFSWTFFALVGLGMYKQDVYDHYFGFLFPAPFLIIGGISEHLLRSRKLLITLVVIISVFGLTLAALINNPFRYAPNNQLGRAEDVSKKIEESSGGSRFNLGVIATTNYEDGYKYFLLKDGAPVVDIDSQVKDSITNQLFAVCELPGGRCDPTHSALAAIANFGWSKIDSSWEVDGVTVYKLVHYVK